MENIAKYSSSTYTFLYYEKFIKKKYNKNY
uniref:Uncharacterized protein n=1 Tax=viral metagenome TaxID=1070528 RepID=A0A6C0AXC0_9ZZZZ